MTTTIAPDGEVLKRIELRSPEGLALQLIDWGAAWVSCQVPMDTGPAREVLLGCGNPADYFVQTAFLGATVGRYANRIGNARFSRDGREYRLDANQGGKHQLHGGKSGFSQRRWRIADRGPMHVRFEIDSPDGDQGFPGNVKAAVTYRLEAGLQILTDYEVVTDAATPVCLTNHAYFNLDGQRSDVRKHRLQIAASHYLPIDPEAIPLGHLAAVEGTGFDFREEKAVARDFLHDEQQRQVGGYDHAFLLDQPCLDCDHHAAQLTSADGQLAMLLYTTMPALQFYAGQKLTGTPSRDARPYGECAGLALETQFLPDSPNHPEYPQPSCWLEPGEVWRHKTRLAFVRAS
jgi:aldose 1-epimerase